MQNTLRNKIQNIIDNDQYKDTEITLRLINLINEIDFPITLHKETKSIGELCTNLVTTMSKESIYKDSILTGFTDFDAKFRGFSPGEFVVVGARPGMGKTNFILNMAINMAEKQAVQLFSFDNSETNLAIKVLSCVSEVSMGKFDYDRITPYELEAIKKASEKIANLKLYIKECSYANYQEFKNELLKQIKEKDLKVVFVDFLQSMIPSKFRNNREFEIGYICRELKAIAKEYNICIVATSQLSRAVESRGSSKRPQLSDLRDSGMIEQEADKVIFLYRPEYYTLEMLEDGTSTKNLMEVIVAKNRDGKVDDVRMCCHFHFCKVIDYNHFDFSDFDFGGGIIIDRLNDLGQQEF
jgi:replicative DNA helicase